MNETGWVRMSSRRRVTGRIAALGLVLTAGMGTASIAAAAEAGKGPCHLMEIKPDEKARTFTVQPLKCGGDTPMFGSVVVPKDTKITINTSTIAPRPCKPDEKLSDELKALGAMCFEIPAPGELGKEVTVKILGADGTAWKTGDKLADESWSWPISKLIKAGGAGSPPEGPKVQTDPDPEIDAACTGSADDTTLLWCRAYYGGLRAAELWPEKAPTGKFKPFTTWRDSPHHIEMRGDGAYVLFFSDEKPVSPLPQIDEDDRVVLVVVPSAQDKPVKELRVTACDGADPVRIGGTGRLPGVERIDEPGAREPMDYAMRVVKGCSADAGLKAVLRQGDQDSKSLEVKTLPLHRFTVGLGLIYDFSHDIEYRAASVKGETTSVIVRDDKRVGISPPVPFITFRPVAVDMRRTRRFTEMFGLSLGISLVEPLDHLYLGLLVEPLPGFGLIGGAHFQTEPSLAGGYREGDRFPEGEVPVDERWSAGQTPLFVGLNVDAALLARVLEVIQ